MQPDGDHPDGLGALLADVAAEQDALDAVVAPLDEAGWATPSAAPGWTVRHVVAHLAYFEEQAALARTDPVAFEAGRDALLAEATFDTAGPYRDDPGAPLLARWREARRAMHAAFADADPKDRLPWYGPSMSARSFLTARLMEAWAHGVDVTDGFGLPPSDSARLRHVAHLGFVTRGWSYLVRGREANTEAVRVELVGADGAAWTWGEPSTNRVSGPAIDFCLVVTQRRPLAATGLVVEGAAASEWMSIAQAFAGGASTVERA